MTEIDGSPVWRLRVRRYGDVGFQLFVIVRWVEWNTRGILWDERNWITQTSEMSLGKMKREAFVQRCRRMGLEYLVEDSQAQS